jgi:hypothetical protein
MKWKYFIGLIIVPTIFWIDTIAEAEEIRIRTRNINIHRVQNGSINVDTGKIQVNSSPSILRSRRIPYSGQNIRGGCYQQSVVRLSSRQTDQFSRISNQTSISAHCR